jgi:hypothetical protein
LPNSLPRGQNAQARTRTPARPSGLILRFEHFASKIV